MRHRYHAFRSYAALFFKYFLAIREIMVGHLLLVAAGGFAISMFEQIDISDGIYFAFVTGLTIGYGDISPITDAGRLTSIAIGVIGTVFTGLIVAVATRALADFVIQEEEQ